MGQTILQGRIEVSSLIPDDDEDWIVNATERESGLCLAHTLLPRRLDDVSILMSNVTMAPLSIVAGEAISDLTPVRCIDTLATPPPLVPGDFRHLDGLFDRVDESVSEGQRASLAELCQSYSDVFSRGELDLGETHLAEHRIETGDALPVRQSLRRQPLGLLLAIDEHVRNMLEARVIEPCNGPWASNLVVVKKKDGSLRYCVDYRQLNLVTRRDAYPLPRIDACLDALAGSKYFSAFNLQSGYHQVPMAIEDADKTSFVVRSGTYRFRRVPFGLCNAGSTFQRVMDLALKGLNFDMCLVYLDDIIVFSSDADEHLVRLERLFQRLRTANLKLKPSKCLMLRRSVAFLGHVVSEKGIGTDPDKIDAVRDWPQPTNLHEVRSFLGLAGYYRRFVPAYAEHAAPLHRLSQKGIRFSWTEDCQKAFVKLKEALTISPILAMPTDGEGFVVDTDASNDSIGAVLSQVQGGVERVIAYASRTLSRTERNYCVTRRELLVIVYYAKKFRMYLLGRHFLIRADHSALQWLRRTPEPIGQQARWCEILEEFDFRIEHRARRSHGNADALSRQPCRQCEDEGATTIPGSDPATAGVAAYRATPHNATGFFPNFLMFGRELSAPIDVVLGDHPDDDNHLNRPYSDYVDERRETMTRAYALARVSLGRCAVRSKDHYDLRVRPASYKVGSWVWFYCPRRYTGRSPK